MANDDEATPENFAEFLAQTGDIKTLAQDKVQLRQAPPKARLLRQPIASMADWLDDQPQTPEDWVADAFLSYRRDGVSEADFRKLRKGHYRLDASLDLHSLSERQARQALGEFLRDASEQGYRVLLVIHGRSIRDIDRGPILKTMLDYWLRGRREVLAFCSARLEDGGPGAAYVLIKRRK